MLMLLGRFSGVAFSCQASMPEASSGSSAKHSLDGNDIEITSTSHHHQPRACLTQHNLSSAGSGLRQSVRITRYRGLLDHANLSTARPYWPFVTAGQYHRTQQRSEDCCTAEGLTVYRRRHGIRNQQCCDSTLKQYVHFPASNNSRLPNPHIHAANTTSILIRNLSRRVQERSSQPERKESKSWSLRA